MYNQKYENRNIVQAEINRNDKLITSFNFVDCNSTEKVTINHKDVTIIRGDFKELEFQNEITKYENKWDRIQRIGLCGTHIGKLKAPLYSIITTNFYDDDAPDTKGLVHKDLLLDDLEIEGMADIDNAEIEKLTVQQYANVTIDAHGKIGTARVFGTLHLSGTIPFEHIEIYPGGKIRVWNIEKDDDIPCFVGMRGNVLIQSARGGGFWYFG